VCALGAATLACGSSLSSLENGDARPAIEMPPIELTGVVFEGYHGVLRDLSVVSASATVDMTTHIAHLRDVTIGFADDPNSKVDISAPQGDFHLDADDFALSGGVSGTTAADEHFKSDAVSYVAETRVLVSEVPVELHRSSVVMTGNRMEFEVGTHRLRLWGNVRARVKPQ
jgi:LPS export ABC transporter protein LptC